MKIDFEIIDSLMKCLNMIFSILLNVMIEVYKGMRNFYR